MAHRMWAHDSQAPRSALWLSWTVIAAIGAGLLVTRLPTLTVLVAIVLAVSLAWIMVGAARALVVLAALTAFAPLPVLMSVGQIDIRTFDVAFAVLLGLAFLRPGAWTSSNLPLWPLMLVLAYIGLSLLVVAQRTPGLLETSVIAWVRVVQTFLLVWITTHVVRSPNDMRRVLVGFLTGGVAAIMVAASLAPWDGIVTVRTGGLHNPNSLGLISALVIVVALFSRVPRRSMSRVALFLVGVLGLGLSRSVASMIAVVVVLGMGATASSHSAWPKRIRGVLVFAVLALFALSFIRMARPDLGGELSRTSVGHRFILGAAGWEMFSRNPLLGVGWQASRAYIGDPTIVRTVRDRFSSIPFVPGEEGGTSVHNAYIHILAELGLVGALLVGFAGLMYWRAFRRLPRGPLRTATALGLIAILIWWNDNPIYGGQVETVIFAMLLGLGSAMAAWPRAVAAHQSSQPGFPPSAQASL